MPRQCCTFGAATGCGGEVKPGPIGELIDLRAFLPDSLRTTSSSGRLVTPHHDTVMVGPDSVSVEIEWRSFEAGGGKYLLSAGARLLAPVKYDSMAFEKSGDPNNAGTHAVPIEAASFLVHWFKRDPGSARRGNVLLYLRADGEFKRL